MITVNEKKFFTLKDLEKKIGVCYMTIHRWKNRIPMVKIGNRNYIEENVYENIEEYIIQK